MAKQPLKFFQYVALKTTEQIEIRRWVGFEMRFFFFALPSPFLSLSLKAKQNKWGLLLQITLHWTDSPHEAQCKQCLSLRVLTMYHL